MTEGMISAGLMIICQDLLKDVWFPADGALSKVGLLASDLSDDARTKIILLIPCRVSDKQWSLTVVDRRERTAYRFSAEDEYRGRLTKHDLDYWLAKRKLLGSKSKHVRVPSWEPVGGWQSGWLIFRACARLLA